MMQAHAWLGAAWGGCNSTHEKEVGAVFLYNISFSIFSRIGLPSRAKGLDNEGTGFELPIRLGPAAGQGDTLLTAHAGDDLILDSGSNRV
jgi:hypothetical protein